MLKKIDDLIIYRIKYHFPPDNFGGSVKHVLELSAAISPYVKKQRFFVPQMSCANYFDEKFPNEIVRIGASPFSFLPGFSFLNNILFSFFTIKKIKRISDLSGNNVIHVHGLLLGGMISFFRFFFWVRLPVIVMVHGGYSDRTRFLSVSAKIEKRFLSLFPPDFCILLNDGTDIQSFENWLEHKKIPYQSVFHGIDTDFFRPNSKEQLKKDFLILFPHRPIPFKRPDLALKIFQQFLIKTKSQDCKLIFFAASEASHLKEIANNLGIIQFIEFLDVQESDGIKEYLNKCSVVIGTSLESNLGRSVQEAMACEKTVVFFDNGRSSEFIHNWENGILIEPGNLDAFAEVLKSLYEHPDQLRRIGKKARETILMERSWDSRIEQELNIYQKIQTKIF